MSRRRNYATHPSQRPGYGAHTATPMGGYAPNPGVGGVAAPIGAPLASSVGAAPPPLVGGHAQMTPVVGGAAGASMAPLAVGGPTTIAQLPPGISPAPSVAAAPRSITVDLSTSKDSLAGDWVGGFRGPSDSSAASDIAPPPTGQTPRTAAAAAGGTQAPTTAVPTTAVPTTTTTTPISGTVPGAVGNTPPAVLAPPGDSAPALFALPGGSSTSSMLAAAPPTSVATSVTPPVGPPPVGGPPAPTPATATPPPQVVATTAPPPTATTAPPPTATSTPPSTSALHSAVPSLSLPTNEASTTATPPIQMHNNLSTVTAGMATLDIGITPRTPSAASIGGSGYSIAPPTTITTSGAAGSHLGAPPAGGAVASTPRSSSGGGGGGSARRAYAINPDCPPGATPRMPSSVVPTPRPTKGRAGLSSTVGTASRMLPPLPEHQCPSKFLRLTTYAAPRTHAIGLQSGIPFGAVLHPLAPVSNEKEVPIVNFRRSLSLKDIVRCRKCRCYINPFVTFVDGGARWRCNICTYLNDVPPAYRAPLGADGRRTDLAHRPELTHGCVEFIAPEQYTVRAPQPPSYVFVIDVSFYAQSSGMLKAAVEGIKHSLDNLPGDSRAQVGFVTFDAAVHFYSLRAGTSAPHMMVVTDTDHLFLPLADDLLVNLEESRDVVDKLLELLPTIHQNNQSVDSALGAAIKAAWTLMKPVGGRMLVMQTKLPTKKPGLLKNRENPKLLGTDKESTLLRPGVNFFKDFALDCSRHQISVDTFLFSPQYTDVATLSNMSQFTGGELFYYPAFAIYKDGEKFYRDLCNVLKRNTAFEAVMRVRVSQGVTVQQHYGNFFIRSSDLLALPTIDDQKGFCVQLRVQENLALTPYVSVQNALLYTSASGVRTIRVSTVCVPVVSAPSELFARADAGAIVALTAKMGVEKVFTGKLKNAREAIWNKCTDVVAAYQKANNNVGGPLVLPETMQQLPLHVLGLIKHTGFRGGTDVRPDERAHALSLLRMLPCGAMLRAIHPNLYNLKAIAGSIGTAAGEDGRVVMPPPCQLSSEHLDRTGAFLLDDGQYLLLWVGKSTPAEFLMPLFGIPSLYSTDTSWAQLRRFDTELSRRVWAIIDQIRADSTVFQPLHVVREGDPMEYTFFGHFIMDRSKSQPSYFEFLQQLQRSVQDAMKKK